MAKNGENVNPNLFDTRIKITGQNARDVRKVLEAKMKKDRRNTYNNTIVAIILEYGELAAKK